MELKDFVAEALVQVQEGVQEAIRRRGENATAAGAISPAWVEEHVDWEKYVQKMEFDVAVTESTSTSANGKAGIKVLAFGEGGVEGARKSEESTVSRVKFTVPFVPPSQKVLRS